MHVASEATPAEEAGRAALGRLRVLHVIPALAARYGGPTRAALGTVSALRGAGVDARVATTDADGPTRLDVPLEREIEYEGAPCTFFRRRFSEAFKVAPRLAAWLEDAVRRFDVVHVHAVFSHSSWAAARACLDHDVPYVLRPLGSLTGWARSQKRLRRGLAWRLFARNLFERAAAVQYASEEERLQTERIGNAPPAHVGGIGVDPIPATGRPTVPGARAPVTLLHLGRHHPVKNLPALFEALSALRGDGAPAWQLVLAGTGEASYEARLARERARWLPDAPVRQPGWVGAAERARLLEEAGLVVLPSLQENFGLAAAEAMAAGVPVLVSDQVGLAAEVRGRQAGWVCRTDAASIEQALRDALGDEAERRRRGGNGRQLVEERYTWPRIAGSLVDLYTDVLAGPRGASRRASRGQA